jgi:hypothetical protein
VIALIAIGWLIAISVVVILASAYLNQNMRSATARSTLLAANETLEHLFENRSFARIATIARFWKEAAAQHPTLRPIVDLYLDSLDNVRKDVPSIASEAARFIEKIDKARYQEELDELDRELFKSEQNFGEYLWNALYESWWLVSLERKRGKIADIESALNSGNIYRGFRDMDQLLGNKGYLTDPPKVIRKDDNSEVISRELANATSHSLDRSKRQIRNFLVAFSTRYAWHFIRYNLDYVLVIFVAIPFAIELFIQTNELSILNITDLRAIGIVFLLAGLGTKIYEKACGPRWRERHRRAIRSAAMKLYSSFVDYRIERAPLDTAHVLSDKDEIHKRFMTQRTVEESPVPDP